MSEKPINYYVPSQSIWPTLGALGLLFTVIGAGMSVQQLGSNSSSGGWILTLGFIVILVMMFGWFNDVIDESQANLYSE